MHSERVEDLGWMPTLQTGLRSPLTFAEMFFPTIITYDLLTSKSFYVNNVSREEVEVKNFLPKILFT